MNRGCKFRTLLQIDLEGDHVASAGDSRMETSLLSVDQAFDVFYDALQDNFRFYLGDGEGDNPPVFGHCSSKWFCMWRPPYLLVF